MASGYSPRIGQARFHNRIAVGGMDDWPAAEPDVVALSRDVDFLAMRTEMAVLTPSAERPGEPEPDEPERRPTPRPVWERMLIHVEAENAASKGSPGAAPYILLDDHLSRWEGDWSWSAWGLVSPTGTPVAEADGWRLPGVGGRTFGYVAWHTTRPTGSRSSSTR